MPDLGLLTSLRAMMSPTRKRSINQPPRLLQTWIEYLVSNLLRQLLLAASGHFCSFYKRSLTHGAIFPPLFSASPSSGTDKHPVRSGPSRSSHYSWLQIERKCLIINQHLRIYLFILTRDQSTWILSKSLIWSVFGINQIWRWTELLSWSQRVRFQNIQTDKIVAKC